MSLDEARRRRATPPEAVLWFWILRKKLSIALDQWMAVIRRGPWWKLRARKSIRLGELEATEKESSENISRLRDLPIHIELCWPILEMTSQKTLFWLHDLTVKI